MYSGSCSLKWYPRLEKFKNSTESCEFYPATNTGYSYAEKIVITCKIGDKYFKFFNDYKFSSTTSNHQLALSRHYRDIGYDGYSIAVYSMNNIYNKETLKEALLKNIVDQNLTCIAEIFGKKEAEKYQKAIDQKEVDRKLSEKWDRVAKKLYTFDYTKKNIVAKCKEYIEKSGRYSLNFSYNPLSEAQLSKLRLLASDRVCKERLPDSFRTISTDFSKVIELNRMGVSVEYSRQGIDKRSFENWIDILKTMTSETAAALKDIGLSFDDDFSTWREENNLPISKLAELKALCDKLNFELSIDDNRQKELDNYNNLSGLFSA